MLTGISAQLSTPFNPDRSSTIVTCDTPPDSRVQAIRDWLTGFDALAGAELTVASTDASFRRYFRARNGRLSRIVMDAPPDKEDSRSFVQVAAYLGAMKLSGPKVLATDLEQGFLLLSDLGDAQYLQVLRAEPERAGALYGDAIDALVTMQLAGEPFQARLPAYDESLLRFELSLFRDWLCERHMAIEFDGKAMLNWQALCDLLVGNALDQPTVFVHRDYHSRNLMLLKKGNPGILDFQDAVAGPYTYDLVSLLKDCYIRWPEQQVMAWAMSFHRKRRKAVHTTVDSDEFVRQFELMGVQRQLKAAGIFARLSHRDGKSAYLHDIPRTLSYIVAIAPRYPELEFIGELIADRILTGLQGRAT